MSLGKSKLCFTASLLVLVNSASPVEGIDIHINRGYERLRILLEGAFESLVRSVSE